MSAEFHATGIATKLQVTLAGHKDRVIGVVPDRDQVITVALEPIPQKVEGEPKAKKRSDDKEETARAAKKKRGRAKRRTKIVESGKTKFADSFDD